MELRVLGPVGFAVDGQRVGLNRGRQRQLLAFLIAARGATLSADALIDAVWGSTPPPRARASLHSHLSRLRRSLAQAEPAAAELLVTDGHGYRCSLARHDVDATRFEDLVKRARRHLDGAPATARRQLDAALALWRGPAFGELADHELVRPEAVRLERLREGAVADRVDASLAAGDTRGVVVELETRVATQPLDERAAAQLIRAYAIDGRQADALHVYGQLRASLVAELGVDPSPQLQRLREAVLRQDASLTPASLRQRLAPPSTVAPTATGSADVHGDGMDLIGRDADIAAVAELLEGSRVLTVTGPGGVGKTRLTEAVVAALSERFDRVVWCELAGVREADRVPVALLRAFELHELGEQPPEDRLLEALAGQAPLLVIDNGEHVVDVLAPTVDRISRRTDATVLVTSRSPLRLSHERLWHLAPLDAPPAIAGAAEVEASPAGRLLCRRARAVDPSFTLSDDNAPTIASLCRRLDGLPLALELAAARLRALSPEALAARLDQRFELLTGGPSRDAGRHRTLEAVVDWSYGLLTPVEARLFDRLSVFAGSFPLDAAERIGCEEALRTGEVAGVLAQLVDGSLVVAESVTGRRRYRLLDTLRTYGRRRLEATGRLAVVERMHAEDHVRVAEELGTRLRGPDERAAMLDLDASLDDLRVAQGWLLDHGDADRALRLASALHDELTFRPREEVFAWVEEALALPGAEHQPAYPAALATAARAALNRGDLAAARRRAETAVEMARPDELATLWGRYVLTTVALYAGHLDDALHLADQRLELATALGEDLHRALAGVSRVLALRYRGDDCAAIAAATQARAAADASGSDTARAWALYSSGEALLATDADAAAAALESAIAAARRVDRRFIEGVALVSLASSTGRQGQHMRALELFRAALVLWRALGVATQQVTTLRNLVELFVALRADEPAALLHGAVATGPTPSFGDEAERLDAAWLELTSRLDVEVARGIADRGRGRAPDVVVDEALTTIDALTEAGAPSG